MNMSVEYKSVILGGALFVVFTIMLAACVVLLCRKQMRRQLEQIEQMLETAMKGTFRETHFDESLLSAVETKLVHYLETSEVSAERVREEKEKIKELLGDISHQTKTPIANLLLYCQLLEEQIQDHHKVETQELMEDLESSAKVIHSQAKKLKFLIESLVKTSRLETGVLALQPEENEIEELINSAVEQIRPRAEERGLSLEVPEQKEPSGTMVFDLKWTIEALYNLLDNAVKYAKEGTTIQVKTDSYAMFYRIDVINVGIRIPIDEQEKIFHRFYRAKEVSNQEGVGIGLYLTRQIVSSQGGYVKVISGKSEETIFSIFLPVK